MKAKLIIEMPDKCYTCKLRSYISQHNSSQNYCLPRGRELSDFEMDKKKPDWCPLVEVKELKSAYTITPDVPNHLLQGLKDHIIMELYMDIGRQLSHFLKVNERRIPIMASNKMEDFSLEKAMNINDWCNTEFSVTLNL